LLRVLSWRSCSSLTTATHTNDLENGQQVDNMKACSFLKNQSAPNTADTEPCFSRKASLCDMRQRDQRLMDQPVPDLVSCTDACRVAQNTSRLTSASRSCAPTGQSV
jgi:hypothetical protein